jgi:hypothetical protein
MGVNKPYYRTCRQFIDGGYSEGGRSAYILDPNFAESATHYIRAFLLLQEDLLRLFEYIEPSYKNRNTYSFRIHELLFRVCVEIEANCKAILKENGYSRSGDWNMDDYKKIERSHRLSSYYVKLPIWSGTGNRRRPFAAWASSKHLIWYSAYNHTKHDRHAFFQEATFNNLIDAISGLVVILSAQFWTEDFSPARRGLGIRGKGDGMESAIGSYFRVKFPNYLPKSERYDFNWQSLESDPNPFQSYPY